MIQKDMPTLIFGNVVLESNLMGTKVLVYSDDLRSYYKESNPQVCLKVPLHELPENFPEGHLEDLMEGLFTPVKKELEANYPGGFTKACSELCNGSHIGAVIRGYKTNESRPCALELDEVRHQSEHIGGKMLIF